MNQPLRRALRGTLLLASLLTTCLVPDLARAIQLRWSSGTTDLSVLQNTQAVLILQADSAEVLPNSWTFQWTADSLGLSFSAFEATSACLVDTAKVDSLALPSTLADSAANLVTAYFCSYGSSNAASAEFTANLPAGGHGKLKVVALDPADSTQVIESNEVTFNGGVDGDYAPAVMRVSSAHGFTMLRVEAIGADLAGILSGSIWSPALGSTIPLTLVTRSDSMVVAEADIAMDLPACEISFGTSDYQVKCGEVPADGMLRSPPPYQWYFKDADSGFVYPKDFAFIQAPLLVGSQWQRVYHLYYIRHYTDTDTIVGNRRRNEFALGHAWSRDLEHWNSNRFAFVADTLNSSNWDGAHVWAPSIVQFKASNNRDSCIMFYTGVNSAGDQTLGYAAASSIDTVDAPGHWTRKITATLTPQDASEWVRQVHPWDFRDPYVMADPENPGSYLLFYTARMQADPAHLAVGVFRSVVGTFDAWNTLGHYVVTEHSFNVDSVLESPHVFLDAGHSNAAQSDSATWRLMYTDGQWTNLRKAVMFNTKNFGVSLTDTREGSWTTSAVGLGDYLNFTDNSIEYGAQASEILQIWGTYFWGGYNGDELVFRKIVWSGGDFALAEVNFLSVAPPKVKGAASLRLAELVLGRGTVRFHVEVPAAARASVTLYDVMGRVVRTLVDRNFEAGTSEVTWDGRDRYGAKASSAVYFARLRVGSDAHVVRVPFVR
jgi:hypothetical protein